MKKAFLASLILTLSISLFAQEGTMMKSDPSTSDGSMMKSSDAMKKDGAMMKSSETMKKDGAMMDSSAYDLAGLGKQVVPFTTEKEAWTVAKNQTVVYFFAATWCPDCRATYQDIRTNFATIPMGVTIVFVNYDKATDLKKKYGVTSQHTFVVIGPMGQKKKVWSGSTTVADLVKNARMM